MNYERKIENLERAVLHLSKALNDLIAAQQASKIGGPVVKGLLWTNPDDALKDAHANIEQALRALSGDL